MQRKELRNQIQAIKKSLPNLDKKAKKQAQEQIKSLEQQIQSLAQDPIESSQTLQPEDPYHDKKPNRQQLRKQKKEAQMEQMRQEAANEPVINHAQIEREQMDAFLALKGLTIHRIQPDGNCLFNALSHQLNSKTTQGDLRLMAVQEMLRNRADYENFATDENGDPVDFDLYCQQMSDKAWGGHLEIQALSRSLPRRIEVYRADGSVNQFGEGSVLRISYHEFEFGLGSHYNSLVSSSQ